MAVVHDGCKLLVHCDALSSVLAVTLRGTKSKMLKHIFEKLDLVPDFKQIRRNIIATHEKGEGNVLADAASRAQVKVIKEVTAVMRIRAIRRHLNTRAVEFIHESVAYARSLSHEEQDLAPSQANTPTSASFAMYHIPRLVSITGRICDEVPSGQGHKEPDAGEQDSQVAQAREQPQSRQPVVRVQRSAVVERRTPHEERTLKRHKSRSVLQCGRHQALRDLASQAAASVSVSIAHESVLISQHVNVRQLMAAMFLFILDAVPAATLDVDGRDWAHWVLHTRQLGEPAWRSNVAAHRGYDVSKYWVEVVLQASVYFRVLKHTKPRSVKLDRHGNEIAAKPESCTVVKSVRRIHGYSFGIEMAQSKLYSGVLKAATDRFIENHGLSALNPSRKLPFTNQDIVNMVSLPEGATVGGVVVSSRNRLWRSIELLIHVLAQTGFRLADALQLNRDAVMYDVRGEVFHLATSDMLTMAGTHTYAVVSPQRTKSDPLGTYWSPHPVYLDMERGAVLRPGYLLAAQEVDFPTEGHRSTHPLFTDDAGSRLRRPFLEDCLRHLCVLTSVDSNTHSWHSFRMCLAVALKDAGADNSRIKAMLRWVSDKSLEIYARDNAHQYTAWLRKAGSATVNTVYPHNVPEIDDDDAVARLAVMCRERTLE